MKTQPYLLHALSPLHAGTGQAADVIDLPIARMRATGIPIVPGSSVKGVLRDARQRAGDNNRVHAVFGPPQDNASLHAGALVVSDARLLSLPVRSFRGTFAWVTSPLLLTLALRDLSTVSGVGAHPTAAPVIQGRKAVVASTDESLNVHGRGAEARVFLEDLDLKVATDKTVAAWAGFLAPYVAPAEAAMMFAQRLVVVDDETMTFLWETATQVDTRIRLDEGTRTVAKGALWVEESLPPETLLVGLLSADRSRRQEGVKLSPDDVLGAALPSREVLQFGGKATVGRGRCWMIPLGAREEQAQ